MMQKLLTVIVGFSKWILKGCKTELEEEIYGNDRNLKNVKGNNYLIGLIIFFILIFLLIWFVV
jgi:hypothetical protein